MSATLEPFGTRKVQQVLAMKQRMQLYFQNKVGYVIVFDMHLL